MKLVNQRREGEQTEESGNSGAQGSDVTINGGNTEEQSETSKRPSPSLVRRISQGIDNNLQKFFGHVGYCSGQYPERTIALSVLCTAILLSGLVEYSEESRPEQLFVPETAEVLDQLGIIGREFRGEPRKTVVYIYGRERGQNILTYKALEEAFVVEDVARATVATATVPGVDTTRWTFQDACLKRRSEDGNDEVCYLTSILDIWENKTALTSDMEAGIDIGEKISQLHESGELDDRFGERIILERYLGGISYGSNGYIQGARALRMEFKLQDRSFFRDGETIDPVGEEWELQFVDNLGKTRTDGKQASFEEVAAIANAPAAFSEEFSDAIGDDLALVGVSIVVLILYVCFQFSGKPFVRSSIGLALGAVATVGLSLAWAYGLGATLSPFTQVHNVLPFLLFGIGVDDVFVVREAYLRSHKEGSPGRRMQEAIAEVGSSLLLTSLTDFTAFMIGSTTVLPALSAFAEWAAFGVMGAFVLSITFFASLVVLDERRKQEKRVDVLCCCTSKVGTNDEESAGDRDNSMSRRDTDETFKADNQIKTSRSSNTDDVNGNYSTSGEYGQETRQGYLVRKYGELLLSTYGRVVVLLAFSGLVAFSAVGIASQLKVEFRQEWFLPAGSYLKRFFEVENTYFAESGPQVEVYMRDVNTFEDRQFLSSVPGTVSRNRFVEEKGLVFWYSQFLRDVNVSMVTDRDAFNGILSAWFNNEGRRFLPDVTFDDKEEGIIGISRLRAFYERLDSSSDKVDAMETLREDVNIVARENGFPQTDVFPFSQEYTDWEVFIVVKEESIRNLTVAVAATFVVVMLFLGSFAGSVIATLAVALCLLSIAGTMGFWDVTLEGVSVINLVLAIGLTVDYTVHIVHSFLHKQGTRTERAQQALNTMGISVLNGATSTFLAIVVLSASGSFIFEVFFKMFFLSCVFGAGRLLLCYPLAF
eukprot:gb/GECG01014721.1/.p1 GENE.gb/GECG01014721.1/~~gb/GECG01014721.1/.p1  ORF type:complete len:934 (+),score=112.98 gb/GECG01014721.1/:1-2802(+)